MARDIDSMSLEFAEAAWRLGWLTAGEKLPDIACRALQSGHDCQSLRELAALVRPPLVDAGPLFARAFEELERPVLNSEQAARRLAVYHARWIVDGELRPVEDSGALSELQRELPELEDLAWFDVLAPEWDCLDNRAELEAGLVESARRFLANQGT